MISNYQTMNNELKNDKNWLNSRWQNVTGEFARCSGFTYKPYHIIINEAVEEYLGQFSDDNHGYDRLTIPILGYYGKSKTIAKWRRYAKRSQTIHERLFKEGAFEYIDRGNVKFGDEIGFLITKTECGEFIIYLLHNNNQIIGDLNHPKYGYKHDCRLRKLYKEFRKEYYEANEDEHKSKYKTHVSNVIPGFPRYISKVNGNHNNWPSIASFGDEANRLCFGINTFSYEYSHPSIISSSLGSWRRGKPFAFLPFPSGYDKRPIPIHIPPVDEQFIKSIISADPNISCDAIKEFINCHDAFIVGDEGGDLKYNNGIIEIIEHKAWSIKVVTRDVDASTGRHVSVIINYNIENGGISISNIKSLRAKLSCENGRVVLPNSHICHLPLVDLRLHNSWITIFQLEFNERGEAEEIKEYLDIYKNCSVLNRYVCEDTVIIRDSLADEKYRIWIKGRTIPEIYRVDYGRGEMEFKELKCTDKIKKHLLPVLAHAVISKHSFLYNGRGPDALQFIYDNVKYKFSLSGIEYGAVFFSEGYLGEDENGRTIWESEGINISKRVLKDGVSVSRIDQVDFHLSSYIQKSDDGITHRMGLSASMEDDDYLPKLFKAEDMQKGSDKNAIDFSEYIQFTLELYERLKQLHPYSHYINNRVFTYLGKDRQTLSILSDMDGEFAEVRIGSLLRSNNGEDFYVAQCDETEDMVDYITNSIGFNQDIPIINPNIANLKDFSQTPVLTSELYSDLLSLGSQMRLTKERQSHHLEGKPDKWTIFYGKGSMTLTLTENSRIGNLIYSKNGINYYTKPCDVEGHKGK